MRFHANGKLLLSGEYFVLDGALALALPVNKGQSLEVSFSDKTENILQWKSLDVDDQIWFSASLSLPSFEIISNSDSKTGATLQSILLAVREMSPTFLSEVYSCDVVTRLEFPRLWGFGSSSTLIHLISQWAQVDPFLLLEKTMGGSGYDIACAGADGPLFYKRTNGIPEMRRIDFQPNFADNLYFVYLGHKQNSREGIAHYRQRSSLLRSVYAEISKLSQRFLTCKTLADFSALVIEHENLVSSSLELSKVKDLYFQDFPGEAKSLGAWGGDFVLLASEIEESNLREYCYEKGFEIVLNYGDLVL